MKIEVKPIGTVKREDQTKIIVENEYVDALEKIECFSHLIIIYWLHKVEDNHRKIVKIKPKLKETPTLGVFATRFPARPNPIGLTTVKLLKRNGSTLIVDGLDAEDGTPILDIKPYIPIYDKPKGRVKLPKWVEKHIKNHKHFENHTYKDILKMIEQYYRIQ